MTKELKSVRDVLVKLAFVESLIQDDCGIWMDTDVKKALATLDSIMAVPAGYVMVSPQAVKLINSMAEQYTSDECREKDINVSGVFEDAYDMFVRDSRKLKAMLSAAPKHGGEV